MAAVAALALDPLDLTSLEPATQVTCVETMTRLLCSLELPLQFLVRRRRLVITDVQTATAGPIAAALDAAVLRHQAEMLAARPAFRSSVLAVMRRDDGDVAALHRQLAMASEMLRSAGLRPRAVSDGELALPDAVEAGQASAGVVRERIRCVAVAGGARCGLELERLPGRAVTLGWAGAMLAAAAEFDAAIHLMPIDAAAAHRAVERRLRNLTADRLLEIDRGRIGDARVDVGLEAAGSLRDRLARNEVRPLRLSIAIAARGPTETEARHAAVLRGTEPRAEEAPAGKLVDSAAAATCLPLTETLCDDPCGYRFGVTRRSGVPVSVDVFDTAHHSNANLAVFATSGHGKSFTIGALVLEATTRGVGSLIVDPEGEYQRLMHAIGGQYLRLGSPGSGALNVFDAAPSPADAIPVAVDLVHVLCGSVLGEVERACVDAALHDAVAAASTESRAPLLGDCVAALTHAAPRAATVLRRVCAGPLGAIFNRPSDIDLDSELCAISLRDLPHEFVPAATLLIAQWLWTRVRGQRRRRHIVLDEPSL
ncbi:MAG TPA: DUF87 domain-containing protein [Candidatus Dormibacteraeota bacterium]